MQKYVNWDVNINWEGTSKCVELSYTIIVISLE